MPELPEVESIRLYLEPYLLGKMITEVHVLEPTSFHGNAEELRGTTITHITRKGKILTFQLSTPQTHHLFLSVHLKLSGQILYATNAKTPVFHNIIPLAHTKRMPGRTTRVILHFNDNDALYFNDMRKFGWMKLGTNPEEPDAVDVLSPDFTLEYLRNVLKNTRRSIKVVLMDQNKMAGIGNIYANDALWEAQIHPARKTDSLTKEEIKHLYHAIIKTIQAGLRYKGSSAKDELYVLPNSDKGQYQDHFKTYHQEGKLCRRCGSTIKRMTLGGRGTFYCSECQPTHTV